MKPTLFVALLFLLINSAFAQFAPLKATYKAFIHSDINSWEHTLDSLQKAFRENPSDKLLFQIALSQYGLAGYKIGVDENQAGKNYLNGAWKNSGLLMDAHPEWTAVRAMRSGLVGYKIALAPYKAPFLGLKSINYVKNALQDDSTCAFAWMEKGHIAFFASFMGYGYGRASDYYAKAAGYFEQKNMAKDNWLYMNTLVHLAKAYAKNDELDEAKKVYERILRMEPGFKWVKDELYPELKKQMRQSMR